MKAKVLMYDKTGTKVIVKNKELTPIGANVYSTLISVDEYGNTANDTFGVVFAIGGVYFNYCNDSRWSMDEPKYRAEYVKARDAWCESMEKDASENRFISLLAIRVFELLGKDTAPLVQARENYLLACEQRREANRQRAAEKQAQQQRQEQERLNDCKRRFLADEKITGAEFLDLAKRDGFDIHIRTKGTFRKSVASLQKSGVMCYYKHKGKSAPDLKGCFRAVKDYIAFLKTA